MLQRKKTLKEKKNYSLKNIEGYENTFYIASFSNTEQSEDESSNKLNLDK